MKFLTIVVCFAVAFPAAAVAGDTRASRFRTVDAFEAAVHDVPVVLTTFRHPATNQLAPKNFAISDVTITGGEERLSEVIEKWHGRVIRDELVSSYRALTARDIAPADLRGLRVLDVETFRAGEGYDWPRLQTVYPDVRAVVRISTPAVDTLNTIAIFRFEVVAETGRVVSGYSTLEKQSDGYWKHVRAAVGNLW